MVSVVGWVLNIRMYSRIENAHIKDECLCGSYSAISVEENHLFVGENGEMLPRKKNGKYITAPGKF